MKKEATTYKGVTLHPSGVQRKGHKVTYLWAYEMEIVTRLGFTVKDKQLPNTLAMTKQELNELLKLGYTVRNGIVIKPSNERG